VKTLVKPISEDSVAEAADLLRSGEVVAFPTETVYGLGANALDEVAVRKIYAAKGRPSDNPLIVHISSREQLEQLVSAIPERAKKLMQSFWPGPLTLVFPKSAIVPDVITGGGETVAIRWPIHPVAQELIRQSGVPVAAPSANLSGKPSPTRAEHVLEDLNGRIPLILDGGQTDIGLESTVLDISGNETVLLRPGKISLSELEEVLCENVSLAKSSEGVLKSPGMKYRHYAPKAKVVLFTDLSELRLESEENEALLSLNSLPLQKVKNQTDFSGDRQRFAHELFSTLRDLDEQGIQSVYIERVDLSGLGQAIMDRLNRAAERS